MRRITIVLLSCWAWAVLVPLVYAGVAGTINQGNQFYKSAEYDRAIEKYNAALQKQSESDIINFNLGNALYKKGQYKDATGHFQKVLLSEDRGLKQKAHYNSGNALYRQGEALSSKNPGLAVPLLMQSLDQYEQALNMDQEDQEAKSNYDFVKRFLEKIKKQAQQQQQNQQQSQQQQGRSQKDSETSSADDQSQAQNSQTGQEPPEGAKDSQNLSSAETQQLNGNSSSEEKKDQLSVVSAAKAQRTLDEYEQSKEAKQFLNLKEPFSSRPVLKDW